MIERRKNKLSKRATMLLDGLEANDHLTKREWSKRIYGDDQHKHHVDNLIRRLRTHGHPFVLIPDDPTAFPPKAGIVRLANRTKSRQDSEHVNGRMGSDVKTRLQTYRLVVVAIIQEFPMLVSDVQLELEDVLRIVLQAKVNLLTNTQPHVQRLPSGHAFANKAEA